MKRKSPKRITRTRRNNSQSGFIKNFFVGLKRSAKQRRAALFALGFALIGAYLVVAALAASKPSYFGNSEYWMGRVRACESGEGVWGSFDYGAEGGAYGYSDDDWDNFGGFTKAEFAPKVIQDDKFNADWQNPETGSNLWKDSMDCWKPVGTIAKAPCLPVPKNPDPATLQTEFLDQKPLDPCCDSPEFQAEIIKNIKNPEDNTSDLET